MIGRRELLRAAGGGLALAGSGTWFARAAFGREAFAASGNLGNDMLPAGAVAEQLLDALPGKRPLIKKSYRPPNYETPIGYFHEEFTPNDAFFVRYHLADIPKVNAATWQLKVGGDAAEREVAFDFEQLTRDFEAVELSAVCQCSGNRRGLS
ncbi:MAG TPA: molybdopterin-dependent oxidoreductase, partial [Alphaproteobacteria bacterium]